MRLGRGAIRWKGNPLQFMLRWVREFGKQLVLGFTICSFCSWGGNSTGMDESNFNSVREGGKGGIFLVFSPRWRYDKEGGKESIMLQKQAPSTSFERVRGRLLMGWLKNAPKIRCNNDGGYFVIGLLKFSPKVIWVIEEGRLSILWSKWDPKVMWVTIGGIEFSRITSLNKKSKIMYFALFGMGKDSATTFSGLINLTISFFGILKK